ncbi:MAG TPA: hypothetical protein VIU93_08230 [Gallionellaceae bacterium]
MTATPGDITAASVLRPARLAITSLMAGLILLVIFAFSIRFYQQFYIPKLIVFYVMGALSLLLLICRPQQRMPPMRVLLFMATFLLVLSIQVALSPAPLTSSMQLAFYVGAMLLYLALLQFDAAGITVLLKVVFAAALLQLVIIALQQFGTPALLTTALVSEHERLLGTVGNPEFLATLLGVAFFIGLHLREHEHQQLRRGLLLLAAVALLVGMLLTHNKGALLFIGAYFLWRRVPNYRLMLVIALLALVLAVFVFPDSIKGRALLWLVAASMVAQNLFAGVGLLQFENRYLDVVHELYSAHPALSDALGSHTAMSMDAHNLFLHFGAELGAAGLVLAILLALHILNTVRSSQGYLGAALLLVLFKCMYTVVLTSVTGMLLLVLLLVALSPASTAASSRLPRFAFTAAAPVVMALLVFTASLTLSDHYYQRGIRSLFLGQADAAENLQHALLINDENADASLALAHVSYLQYDYPAMQHYIEHAIQYRKNKDSYKIAGSLYFYAKRYDEAFEIYQFLHATFPQHLTSITKLASLYMIRGNYDMAHNMAQLALDTVPRKPAQSDEKNLAIARQILKDSSPHLSPLTPG